MDIVLVAGLWLDGPAAWRDVAAELAALGHRAVPVLLPGQGDGNTGATLANQVDAVLKAVDAAAGKPMVVGHSAAATLAWLAADARPGNISTVVMIGGFPAPDGSAYFDGLPVRDGALPFPGWSEFEGPDSADLDQTARQSIDSAAIPLPEGVANGMVRLTDERRYGVPVVLICPEFSPEAAREWIDQGQVPELARAARLTLADIDSGHWPMFTAPAALARLLAQAAEAS